MEDFELVPITEAEKPEEKRNPSWFKPGNNANPHGRPPKGYSLTEAVKDLLTKNPERKKKIIEKIITLAEGGDPVFVKLAWNYMDGMPKQEIEQTGGLDLNVNTTLEKVYGNKTPESTSTT